jgi:uncharacterized protein YerC
LQNLAYEKSKYLAKKVKFGRPVGKINKNSLYKAERIRIFLMARKSYDWISKELSISKKTISNIKKSLSFPRSLNKMDEHP